MSKQWADQPYALLPLPGQPGQPTSTDKDVLAMAIEMAHVHNAILRGMNSIYLQCEQIHEPSDVKDFVTYIKTWGDMVHHHHSMEETIAFPEWEKIVKEAGALESVTSTNVEQHHAFEEGFEKLRTYAGEVRDGKAEYNGKKVTAILESFAPVLNQHLHDEVKMILELERYDGAALKKVLDQAAQEGLKTADPVGALPKGAVQRLLTTFRISSSL
ncbi:hypothetical protein N0V90_004426 [Kalmusia sp. IMI 367209]|nr:hypothetical protein N0V90_004426 [Kalmusia sp. IMI 367209]